MKGFGFPAMILFFYSAVNGELLMIFEEEGTESDIFTLRRCVYTLGIGKRILRARR